MIWFIYLQGHCDCCFGTGLGGDQSGSREAVASQVGGDGGPGMAAVDMERGARIPDVCRKSADQTYRRAGCAG